MKTFSQYIAEETKLPDLTGSDKQVKWAKQIRDRYLNWDTVHVFGRAVNKEIIKQFREWISTIKSASFFIEYRDDLLTYFMLKLVIERMESSIKGMNEDEIYKRLNEIRLKMLSISIPKKDDLSIRYEKLKGNRDIDAYFRNK